MKEQLNWGLLSKYRTELYGIATVMIMIFHSQVIVDLPDFFDAINSHLNYGVDIFLFLSGVCLYFSYSKDNNYGRFMKKRCERTLLPYLMIGFFFWIWKYIIAQFSILDFLYNISGLSLILVKKDGVLTIGNPTIWYVAFIMGVYALYPLFYNLFFNVSEKKKKLNLIFLLASAVILAVFIKYYVTDSYNATEVWLTRIPVFILGCYFGRSVKEKKIFRIYDYILFFLFIPMKALEMLLRAYLDEKMIHRYVGLFGALFICFIVVFIFEKLNIKLIRKICIFFGNLSLEIYMIHVMLYNIVLYYYPNISKSTMFSSAQKVLIYCGILAVSIILSFIFRKVFDCFLKKIKGGKENRLKLKVNS